MSKPLWNHSVQHQSFGLSAGFAALPLPLLMRGSQDGHEMGSGEAIGPESSAAPKVMCLRLEILRCLARACLLFRRVAGM